MLSLDFLLSVQQALDQLHVAKAGGDVGDEHFEQRAVQGGERLAGIEKDGGVMVRGDLQVQHGVIGAKNVLTPGDAAQNGRNDP